MRSHLFFEQVSCRHPQQLAGVPCHAALPADDDAAITVLFSAGI